MGYKMGDWVQQFKSQFGDAVCTDDVVRCAHSDQDIVPVCVCIPESEAQAAAMICFAEAHKIPVVPCGSGVSEGSCAPPPSEFLALSTKRLNKLIHHEPGDMVATVQAGMPFHQFSDSIATKGQWLPVDAPPEATIGGIVAQNTHGPRSLGYGTLRDMILGMTVINGDGVIRKCGGKVVKNVTGYALDKLYIGSFGTLGLISEVTFKLRPLPVDGIFYDVFFATTNESISAMHAIAAKNLPLEILQVFKYSRSDPRFFLRVAATGTPAELARIIEDLRQSVPENEFSTSSKTDVEERRSNGASVADISWTNGIFAYRGRQSLPFLNGATLHIGYVSSKLDSALKIVERYIDGYRSIGMTEAVIDIDPLSEVEAARIASEFEKLGVNFAFENIVGVNIPNRWGTPRPEWAIMKQIKAALDPQGIMNPGRFVV